jgi:sugar phosphate permease
MGLLNVSATTAVSNWFVRQRGRALGITVGGSAIGITVLTPVIQWMLDVSSWRVAWLAVAAATVLTLTPLAAWLVRRRPEDVGLYPDGDSSPGHIVRASPSTLATGRDWSLNEALRVRSYWLLVISGSLIMCAVAGANLHQVPLLTDNGLSAPTVAWLISLYGLGWMAGSVVWGLIAERIPTRYALALAYAIGSVCIVGALVVRDVASGVLYAGAFGLTQGGKESLDAAVWANYFGRRHLGAIRGFSRPFVVGSNAAGSVVGAIAFDTLHSYVLVFILFGLMSAIAALLAVAALPPRAPAAA